MGGYGSGFQFGAKRTEEDYRDIKISNLHKWGYTSEGKIGEIEWTRRGKVVSTIVVVAGDEAMGFMYVRTDSDGGKTTMNYKVHLSWSDCHFGGKRPWFLCPACDRRVGILYAERYYLCRHCLNLNYQSTRERDFDRAAKQAGKIRDKLGWEPGILNHIGGKPEGMHEITFHRLISKYERYTRRAYKGMMAYIGVDSTRFD